MKIEEIIDKWTALIGNTSWTYNEMEAFLGDFAADILEEAANHFIELAEPDGLAWNSDDVERELRRLAQSNKGPECKPDDSHR